MAIRPVFAGKAFASMGFSASPAMVSIRPNVFPARETPGRRRAWKPSLQRAGSQQLDGEGRGVPAFRVAVPKMWRKPPSSSPGGGA